MPNDINISEKELFRLISEGDEAAFERLFFIYYPRIEPVIFKITRTEAVINDIIQEVFIKLWITRDKLPKIDSPENWIFRIVYNSAYTWMRKNKLNERVANQSNINKEAEGELFEAETIFDFNETSRVLKEAIQNLPPKAKSIYLMRESGLKNPEIAHKLGISQNTVKSTLTRSVQEMRKYMVSRGIELPLILIAWFL